MQHEQTDVEDESHQEPQDWKSSKDSKSEGPEHRADDGYNLSESDRGLLHANLRTSLSIPYDELSSSYANDGSNGKSYDLLAFLLNESL